LWSPPPLVPGGAPEVNAELFTGYLHPNAKGYQIWADAIDGAVKEMMGGA
jgi:lysophospholipase L1-like esterase